MWTMVTFKVIDLPKLGSNTPMVGVFHVPCWKQLLCNHMDVFSFLFSGSIIGLLYEFNGGGWIYRWKTD